MLGSTTLILFAIYFLNKLNPNFIPKEVKLWISCISSCLWHVWCHLTAGKNLTFSFCPVLPTAGPGNKVNSKTISSCIVMLVMTAAKIWSCKSTLVCCCERWVNTIQDCTTETWVDYCQLGEDCSFSPEILKLQRSCCLLSLWYSAPCSGPQFDHSVWGQGSELCTLTDMQALIQPTFLIHEFLILQICYNYYHLYILSVHTGIWLAAAGMVWGLNPHPSRPALWPNQPPVRWVPEGMWPGHGVDHATPTQRRG